MAEDEEQELVWQNLYEGCIVKMWDTDDKTWKRGNVVDFVKFHLDKKPIKVQVQAKKKKDRKEVWLPVDGVRLINKVKVDWETIEQKLPVRQDPESREVRAKLFDRLDENGGGSLSLTELKTGVPEVIGRDVGSDVEELNTVIKRAYESARRLAKPKKKKKGAKAMDKVIDRTEFHGFVQALRHVLQLAELFELLDMGGEDDQLLSHRECLKGICHFWEWNVDEDKLATLFEGQQAWTPKLKFADFADFLIECRWQKLDVQLDDDDSEEVVQAKVAYDMREDKFIDRTDSYHSNKQKILGIFKQWDVDGSGEITQEEMSAVLTKLDPNMTPDMVKSLFAMSDANNDGVLDIDEFVKWILV